MTICYIPAVTVASTVATSEPVIVQKGWIEQAISDAIQHTIVDPFYSWCNGIWIQIVDMSYILCLSVAIGGVICGICGIKKGYKWSVISILFYLLIRMVSWYNGWY